MDSFFLTPEIKIGGESPLVLFAGPCVIEDEANLFYLAQAIKEITSQLALPFIFKASFDKANRTSWQSYRGPGLKEGLRLLKSIKEELHVPILTDIHEPGQGEAVGEVADIIQIPAFLCRQTDLIKAAAETQKPVNIKKGQFLAPSELEHIAEKAAATGNKRIVFTERGTSFGYHNLVVDMRSFLLMHDLGYPVVFDATHSVQIPGGLGQTSGGENRFVLPLARAAVAVGVQGLFFEVHQDPTRALCDGPNMVPLAALAGVLREVLAIDKARREVSS